MYPESLLSSREEARQLRHRARVAPGFLDDSRDVKLRERAILVERHSSDNVYRYFERAVRSQEIKAIKRGATGRAEVHKEVNIAYSNAVRVCFLVGVILITLGLPTIVGSAVLKNVSAAMAGIIIAIAGLVLFRISVGAKPTALTAAE